MTEQSNVEIHATLSHTNSFGAVLREVMQSEPQLSNFGDDYQMKTVVSWVKDANLPSKYLLFILILAEDELTYYHYDLGSAKKVIEAPEKGTLFPFQAEERVS